MYFVLFSCDNKKKKKHVKIISIKVSYKKGIPCFNGQVEMKQSQVKGTPSNTEQS